LSCGVGAEYHQQAASKPADCGGQQHRQQLIADQEADQRSHRRGQCRQQQLTQALPVRAGLIGEHRVQCARADAQTDLRMAGRHADAQRQYHRRAIADDHSPRHVRPFDPGQALDRMGA
jgi:hypothetical protein